ncbi:hypothetical protein ABPG73_000589 [Tetrahymena malaccensis]
MSIANCSFSICEDYENFQTKSIQGKLFDQCAFNNLQGDNEYINNPSLNNFQITKEIKLIDTQDMNYSLYLGQISDVRQNQDFVSDQNSAKVKASEIQLSYKQVIQAEISKSSSKQNLEDVNKQQETNYDKNSCDIGRGNESQEQNYNQQISCNTKSRVHQCSISKISQIQDNSQKQQHNQSQDIVISNEKQNNKKLRLSIQNYQKAASIINKIINVLVNLNTAYFNQDAIVLNRKKIIWRYLKSHIFFTDTISLSVMASKLIFKSQNLIYNPSQSFQTIFFNFLVFFKLNGTQQKANRFGQAFTLKEYQKHTLRLFNQLFTVISVAHTVSLAWYYLGMYQIDNGYPISWLQKFELIELSYIQKYIYCMYWSITTMTTGIQIEKMLTYLQRVGQGTI